MKLSRRRMMQVLTGAGLVGISAAGLARCDSMPAAAVAAWRGPDDALTDLRLRLLSWALLAPNPHNRQPWLADLREPGRIVLHIDRNRLLPHTDPMGRQILIGCGAFLELLALAAAAAGHRAEIAAFPAGEFDGAQLDGRPFAAVTLVRDDGVRPDPLFAAVLGRRTNKQPFTAGQPLTPAEGQALGGVALPPGLALRVAQDAATVAALRALARRAWRIEIETPRTFQESVDLLRIGAGEIAADPDGIPLHGPKIWIGKQLGMLDRRGMTNPDSAGFKSALARIESVLPETHAFGWLVSADNARRSQLAAGRAYMRLDLTAARLGVALQPLSQILQEYPEMAAAQGDFDRLAGIAAPARVQMLVRLGHAPAAPQTPRRPVRALVLDPGA